VAIVAGHLRSFLRYLWLTDVLPADLGPSLPKPRVWKEASIPTVWSENEMKAILAAVDRSSPKGKRDYAILLLASKLGLRSSDIRKLKQENLRWEQSRLEIVQSKTGAPLVLPLLEDVGQALIDYLRHVRPQSRHREVFLRMNAPFTPFASNGAFHTMLDFYKRRAKVTAAQGRGGGLHSLRHTLATRLLEKDTPLEVISDVLGHLSVESTHTYTRVNIKGLRTAALNPDIPEQKESSDV